MREKIELPEFDSVERVERIATDVPPEWYKPYGDSLSDVPPMANFGEGYRYHITGLFHDVLGYPTTRLDEIDPWIERVHRKIERNLNDIIMVEEDCIGKRQDGRGHIWCVGTQRPACGQAGTPAAHQGWDGHLADAYGRLLKMRSAGWRRLPNGSSSLR